MKKLTQTLKYWSQLLLLPIYWFSFITPRNKNIWLFGSTFGRRFADNPRYFYLYINQHEKNIRPIWISRNKEIISFLNNNNYEAYYYCSLKGIYYCLIGKVYIFDNYSKDINFWLSGGAKKINLWHGIPLKKIQADNINDKIRHPKNNWEKFISFPRRLSDEKPTHYVLTTSILLKDIFSSAFRTGNVLIEGYPRNDKLISNEINNLILPIEKNILRIIQNFKFSKSRSEILYYMPTFRDSEIKFFDIVDLQKFSYFLEKNDFLFCAKLHPKSKLKNRFNQISSENFLIIDADTDPYVFIDKADILITDYSSIYFDFLFINRPIIFFDYDLVEYQNNSREMYFDYESFTPGPKVETLDELMKAIKDSTDGIDDFKDQRYKIRDSVFDNTTDISSRYLFHDIKKLL